MGVVRWFRENRTRLAFTFVVLVAAGSLYAYVHNTQVQNNQRRHDNCISRQNLYDGITGLGNLVGHAFNAPQSEIDAQLASLKLGPRPNC